jgi:hypothetical protein
LHAVIKFCQLRAVDIVVKHGLCQFAPNCFGFAFFALFEDANEILFAMATRFAKMAIELAKRQSGKDDWRQHIAGDGLVFRHWMHPHVVNIDDVSMECLFFKTCVFSLAKHLLCSLLHLPILL